MRRHLSGWIDGGFWFRRFITCSLSIPFRIRKDILGILISRWVRGLSVYRSRWCPRLFWSAHYYRPRDIQSDKDKRRTGRQSERERETQSIYFGDP